MALSNPILGCGAALVSSAAWALDPILFRRIGDRMGPTAMNLAKGIIGVLLLCIPLIYFGVDPVDRRTFLLLGVSGILGISLADTFFFMALVRLGARLAILIETLCSVVTVILAVALLVFGPHKLPEIGSTLGKAMREFRKATTALSRDISKELMQDPSQQEKKPDRPASESEQRGPGQGPS